MTLLTRLANAALDFFRPLFGFVGMVCIYEVSCFDYAKQQIADNPWYKAIPRIVIRVCSCNPLVALLRNKKNQ